MLMFIIMIMIELLLIIITIRNPGQQNQEHF